MLEVSIINTDGAVLEKHSGNNIDFEYNGEYAEGDKIVISKKDAEYIALQLDEFLKESIIFSESSRIVFEIPFGALKAGYDERAFSGDKHRIKLYEPTDEQAFGYRNIALNSHDRRGQKKYYPHAYANLVTRDEVCFFERNAIDGVCDNKSHGNYPYYVSGLPLTVEVAKKHEKFANFYFRLTKKI